MSDPFSGLFDFGDVLERVGIDITNLARRGDLEPVRCRDAEIARVIDILLRQGKNNPALVGRAGVGKTAIAEGLAQRVAAGDVPPALKDARILQLDHVSLLAGTSFRGQYEDRIRRLVKSLGADPNLILFVDELHNLIGQGTAMGAAMDAANMLKPALVRGDIRIIGATTGEEYDKWIRTDPALERRFQPVTIEELDAIQTWEVLVARRPRLERHHAVAISDDALKAAIVLTDRFVPERARPDKAIDVLDEACAHAQATAHVSPELDKLIRDRKKVEAMMRRGLTEEEGSAPQEPMPDLATVLQRFGEELNELLGGESRRKTPDESAATSGDVRRPSALEEQRAELDRRLRAELERQGIVTRDGVRGEGIPGGYGAVYAELRALETLGTCRRGYFVEGLGGAQFALGGAVERLRELRPKEGEEAEPLVLAAADAAQPYGAALPWPKRAGARAARVAGAYVVLLGGEAALFVERGGRSLVPLREPEDGWLREALSAFVEHVRMTGVKRLAVERFDGEPVGESEVMPLLLEAGFVAGPRRAVLRP